ncbi:MAG TPA: hypothetical protein VG106_05995 [Vicinamibacterales bacterium]|nr:hypothetical protein [Vicinamibacterales bacterium]
MSERRRSAIAGWVLLANAAWLALTGALALAPDGPYRDAMAESIGRFYPDDSDMTAMALELIDRFGVAFAIVTVVTVIAHVVVGVTLLRNYRWAAIAALVIAGLQVFSQVLVIVPLLVAPQLGLPHPLLAGLSPSIAIPLTAALATLVLASYLAVIAAVAGRFPFRGGVADRSAQAL